MSIQRLVLAGGGHSHLEVLRRLATGAPRCHTTLLNPTDRFCYSGMLPGHVAGHYTAAECQVDLRAMCARAGAALRLGTVTAITPDSRRVICDDGETLTYDVLSLDVGSVPAGLDTPGVREHAVPVRPFPDFLAGWRRIVQRFDGTAPRHIVVVGAGAAGVELALGMQQRTAQTSGPRFTVMTADERILCGHSLSVSRRLARLCARRGIRIETGKRIVALTDGVAQCDGGAQVSADCFVWATGPAAPPLVAASGLATDARGYVAVDECLRSISHPEVFAAGDVAAIGGADKSGVYAVRAAPTLAANLAAAINGTQLACYRPQSRALALIGTGDRRAIGIYGNWSFEGAWVWRWKDRIDRRFVARYQ